MSLKKLIKKLVLASPLLKKVLTKYKIWKDVSSLRKKFEKKLLDEATIMFQKEKPQNGSLEDYKRALYSHLVSYDEYMYQYEFYRLDENQRNEFVSRAANKLFYRTIPKDKKAIFWHKQEFLKKYSSYIHRKWLFVPEASFLEFVKFATIGRCIKKPDDSCCGKGVEIITFPSSESELKALYDQLVNEKCLLEELIHGCKEIQTFHPNSLNSIRVVTVASPNGNVVFGSFIRFGAGNSVVDNAHAGGIFAQVNVETGIVESDGINVNGRTFSVHPDTLLPIKGFCIPLWEEIKKTCIEASYITPENIITGWDVVINDKGEIEFVEGNHGPDFDVMQSPLKVGVKKRLKSLIPNY